MRNCFAKLLLDNGLSETFKMVDNTDKELNTPAKRTKCQNIEKDSLSSTIQNRYNTHSKRTEENPICTGMESNSSQSKKRKQTTDKDNNLSKDKQKNSIDNNNNVTKRRRKNQKESNQKQSTDTEKNPVNQLNNIISQDEIEDTIDTIERETINMDECLKLFNIKISNGPIYVCTVCLQTWFRRSVCNIEFIKISSQAEQKLNQCRRNYVSAEDKEWICKGSRDSIKTGRI